MNNADNDNAKTAVSVIAAQDSEQVKSSAFIPQQQLQNKAEWLKKRIDASLDKVSQRATVNQRKATYLKILSFFLSGSATILLGLQIAGLEGLFKDIAFVFTALITLMTAINTFAKN